MSQRLLLKKRQNNICTLTLNRPEKKNSLSLEKVINMLLQSVGLDEPGRFSGPLWQAKICRKGGPPFWKNANPALRENNDRFLNPHAKTQSDKFKKIRIEKNM